MDEPIKILCVDDEKNVLRSLKRLFLDEEYEIFTADGGKEGLEILKDEKGIQLIISDYRMPGMDGVDFLRQANELNPNTIRIVLSGYADTAAVVAAINEGQIYKFIPKPWNDDDLRVNINKALDVFFLRQANERMAEELMVMNEELKMINDNLEDEVEKRTAELLFQNRVMSFSHVIMDSLPVGVIGLDMSGLIAMSNSHANQIFGINSGSLVGSSAGKILPVELSSLLEEVKKNGFAEIEAVISENRYHVKVNMFHAGEGQEGIVLLFL